MISITNNGASIQLNGDQNVTIVKKDVTKVQAIGINVLIVRKTNGVERKTAIPYTSVNVPSTYPTAQALADYISSILGGFDTSAFIENSNLTYVAQVTTSPFPIPDTDLEVNGATFVSVPSADPTPYDINVVNSVPSSVGSIVGADIVIADSIVEIDGVNEGSVPAEQTVEIDLVDQDANPISPTSVTNVGNNFEVEITLTKDVFIKGIFGAGNDTMEQLTIDADSEGTYTVITDDGGSGTISLEVNGAPTSVPFSLVIGDTLDAVRTVDTNIGFFKISGTYV